MSAVLRSKIRLSILQELNIDRLMFVVLARRVISDHLQRGMEEEDMLIEQRTYDISPGVPMSEFLGEYSKRGLPAQKRILEGFIGYFVTEFGTQNQVNHFWAFTDLEDRRRRRAELAADQEWQDCISVVRPMIIRWDNKIMYPTDFSPIRSLPIASDEPMTAFTYPQTGAQNS